MVALAICAITAAQLHDRTDTQAPPPVRPDQPRHQNPMIPLTVLEVSRAARRSHQHATLPGHADHWSRWTRRHQARSRWFHQRTRLARDADISLVS